MKTYSPSDVRVVGFFGHRASGKTSLVEGVLFNARSTKALGSVDAGNQTLEIDAVALERQTTMQTNVGFAEWDGVRIGIIDTPGDANFYGATARALQVADAGVVTVAAPDGVEPITLRVMQSMSERNVPYAAFVTKLDKEGGDFASAVNEIKSESGRDAVALSIPIGKGADFKGVVSLISQKAYVPDGDKTKEVEVPGDMAAEVAKAREQLFDAVAAADDELAEKYLESGSLSEEELARGLKAAFVKGQLVPVLAGNPLANVGSRVLLDVIKAIFPSPLDRPAIKGYKDSSKSTPVERVPDPNGPLVARAFRTFYDPFAGMLTYVRIFSGKIAAAADIYNSTENTSDRPSHMYFPLGGVKTGVETKEAGVGDVVVLTKLKSTGTGDSLTSKDDPTFLEPFEEPDALLNFGVSAADKKVEEKMAALITKLVEEDPSLRFHRDAETKESILGGLGQPHVDYAVARLKAQQIEIELREPKVPYRETLRTAVREIEGKQKKQTGGSGQFGVCYINVEPLPRGSGIVFSDDIVGGAIPRNFIPSVEKGVRDALKRGPLSGNEVVDLKISLYDGKYHRVDSSDMAFQIAGRKAIRAAFAAKTAKPVLLEPHMEVDITCPAENVGDVMGDLNSRRARVSNMTTEGRRGRITATVPMMEILRYTNVLKSITSGRGSFTMRFASYEEAPPDVQQSVSAAYAGGAAAEDED
ncbi:MAG TPA: elongation factor G [Kofleriaceae bacterium]|nr:elongation factor G [Kofleriaceae bacterium]